MRTFKEAYIPLIALIVVAVLLYWTYPQSLSGFRTAGIVTGWLGSGLLLMSLILMFREPGLAEFLGGLEPMYRWHHRLAVWAYIVLLTHPLLLAVDLWQASPASAWAILSPWQQSWPVRFGWISIVLMMFGLYVALSPKLPYSYWRKLHHLLSLSVVFGVLHLVLLGANGILLIVPALILAFLLLRVVRSDYGLGALPYIVSSVHHLSPSTVEITLKPMAGTLSAVPGQFVLLEFLNSRSFDGCAEYHPFTISEIKPDGCISLGIKDLGDCTHRLQSVQAGGEVRLQGPFGQFFTTMKGPCLWVAGGIGIAPFIAVLRSGPLSYPTQLIYLYRANSDAPYVAELNALAEQQALLNFKPVATGDSNPDLASVLPDTGELTGVECYLCGPPFLVESASALLQQRGVKHAKIHFESFEFR